MSGLSRDDIDEIIRLVEQSSFDELKLEIGDTKIELRRNGAVAAPERCGPALIERAAPDPGPTAPRPIAAGQDASATQATSGTSTTTGIEVPAPQLGIFWHAPRPGEPPFVSVGDTVDDDTIIGIIEVMKLMNTVAAGIAGTVTEVVAPNGRSVQQGDTLIRVQQD
jgi:acetyl-CoA carboxylase biotin carboxyl carrier protein